MLRRENLKINGYGRVAAKPTVLPPLVLKGETLTEILQAHTKTEEGARRGGERMRFFRSARGAQRSRIHFSRVLRLSTGRVGEPRSSGWKFDF